MTIDIGIVSKSRDTSIPCEDGNFPFYNTFKLFDNEWLDDMGDKYGLIWKTRSVIGDIIYVDDADLVQTILTSNSRLAEIYAPPSVKPLTGENSILFAEADHKKLRRILNPMFTPAAVAKRLASIQAVVEHAFEKYMGQNKNIVKGYDLSRWYAAKVLEMVLFGEELGEEQFDEFLQQGWDIVWGLFVHFPINLPFLTYGKALQARSQLQVKFKQLIASGKVTDLSVLGKLYNAKNNEDTSLSEQSIMDNMIAFILAGLITTTNTITRTLQDISTHPKIHQTLLSEIDTIDLSTCTLAQISELKYLDAVIKESMRLDPVVYISFRRVLEDLHLQNNIVIPKNTYLFLRNTKIFKYDKRFEQMRGEMAPQNYFPERWFDEAAQGKRGSFHPFGLGPHACIGMHLAQLEMKTLIANVVQRYDWEMVKKKCEWTDGAIKQPKDGLPLRFKPRCKIAQSRSQQRIRLCGGKSLAVVRA